MLQGAVAALEDGGELGSAERLEEGVVHADGLEVAAGAAGRAGAC